MHRPEPGQTSIVLPWGGACDDRASSGRRSMLAGDKPRAQFRPEIALTRLHLVELLLAHYPDEQAQALTHLDFAIAGFREMKMQPALARALRHKDILRA